jgi:hypothetical protein
MGNFSRKSWREEKRQFAKFNASRGNNIKMDLKKWVMRMWTRFVLLRSGFSDRFLWTPWWKAESCWTTCGTVSFLRTLSLEVTGAHTHTHTHFDLSFGGCVRECARVCVLPSRPLSSGSRIQYVVLTRKPPGCYLFKMNFSSFPRAVKLGQPSYSAVY